MKIGVNPPWGAVSEAYYEGKLPVSPINPPPQDGRCYACRRHISELPPFDQPHLRGMKLLKYFRGDEYGVWACWECRDCLGEPWEEVYKPRPEHGLPEEVPEAWPNQEAKDMKMNVVNLRDNGAKFLTYDEYIGHLRVEDQRERELRARQRRELDIEHGGKGFDQEVLFHKEHSLVLPPTIHVSEIRPFSIVELKCRYDGNLEDVHMLVVTVSGDRIDGFIWHGRPATWFGRMEVNVKNILGCWECPNAMLDGEPYP